MLRNSEPQPTAGKFWSPPATLSAVSTQSTSELTVDGENQLLPSAKNGAASG